MNEISITFYQIFFEAVSIVIIASILMFGTLYVIEAIKDFFEAE